MVPFGYAMLFDAVSLMHGNVINTSQYTRVSFEFRVIKESAYIAEVKGRSNSESGSRLVTTSIGCHRPTSASPTDPGRRL